MPFIEQALNLLFQIVYRTIVEKKVVWFNKIKCGFRRMLLLFFCKRADETISAYSHMNYIQPSVFQIVNLVRKSCIRDQDVIPFIIEETENIGDKCNPIVRLLISDYICSNTLEQCSSIFIFYAIPPKECTAHILHEISVMSYQHSFMICFKQFLQDSCCGILTMLCFTRYTDDFHAYLRSILDVIEQNGNGFLEFIQQRNHSLSHLRMSCGSSTELEEMSPFTHIHGDTNFGLC